jgi:P27 family predicted phage terminase small subunit
MRGRKPQASAIQKATGAYERHPERENKQEPKAQRGRPEVPESIADDLIALDRWEQMCRELDLLGVLTTADFYLLETHCASYSLWRELRDTIRQHGMIDQTERSRSSKPEAKMMLELQRFMNKQLEDLGLTPSSRSRLKVVDEKKDDPFEAWLNS